MTTAIKICNLRLIAQYLGNIIFAVACTDTRDVIIYNRFSRVVTIMSKSTSGGSAGPSKGLASDERDRLVKEFVLITKTDSQVAEYFLGECDWDLQKAIPDYFNVAGEIWQEDKTGLKKVMQNEKWAAELATDTKVLGAFSFITWNIDGLDERNFMRRIENIVSILKAEQADVVFLQEVVHLSMGVITGALPQYEVIMQASCEEYFVVTLLKKDTVRVISRKDEPFANSVMGRGVLSTEVELGGSTKLWLHNTHLESTADFKDARVQQLKGLFSKLTLQGNTHSTILAGDMNLRDAEVGLAGGIPGNCVDVWEACARREECRYTWDAARNSNCLSKGGGGARGNFKPKLRFDRVYLHGCKDNSKPAPMPKHFKLLGLTKVPQSQLYPSDHWAIQVFFTLNKF
ncbi:hypothetical protein B566_EDAN001474 [Ephemera danica]|nr:hypothetical protein B566_EDAN001474 [Ephemera danica]